MVSTSSALTSSGREAADATRSSRADSAGELHEWATTHSPDGGAPRRGKTTVFQRVPQQESTWELVDDATRRRILDA